MAKNKIVVVVDSVLHECRVKGKKIYSRDIVFDFGNSVSITKTIQSDNESNCDQNTISFLKRLRDQLQHELDYLEDI